MVSRRLVLQAFLQAAGACLLGQGLAGCNSQSPLKLTVYFLRGSIASQLLRQFQRQLAAGGQVELKPIPNLSDLFGELQQWHVQPQEPQPATASPVFGLADYWLAEAIQQGLVQPLDPANLEHWAQIPPQWQQLVTRDLQGNLVGADQGQVWGAPYRWGATVIAYRRDKLAKFAWKPADWADLWRPELQGRLSLLDQPREVIGLTLKKLGRSYNTPNPASVNNLVTELAGLHRQVKFYSSDAYLQPLLLGDTWVAVGWSGDILPEARQDDQIQVVVPQSGTALSTDLWVRPASKTAADGALSKLINQWIDFWWQPEIARQLSKFGNGLSPLAISPQFQPDPEALTSRFLLVPDVIERSEFLSPVAQSTVEQFQNLWAGMRRG